MCRHAGQEYHCCRGVPRGRACLIRGGPIVIRSRDPLLKSESRAELKLPRSVAVGSDLAKGGVVIRQVVAVKRIFRNHRRRPNCALLATLKEDISKRRSRSPPNLKVFERVRSRSLAPMVRTWSRYAGAFPAIKGL